MGEAGPNVKPKPEANGSSGSTRDRGSTAVRARDEREADTYAARLLVTPEAFAQSEALVGCRDNALARELNVQALHIALWRADYLKRVGVVRRLRAIGA